MRRRAKRTRSQILVRTPCLRRCSAIRATSPNQQGVEGTDSEEVWMITAPSVILFIMCLLEGMCFVFPSQRGIFYAGSLLFSRSLRTSWAYQRLYQHRRGDLLTERRGPLVNDHPLPVA